MIRYKTWITYALFVLGTMALFAVFIGFRRNAALISALSAAGAVAAAGFAAIAAFGSVRAAYASNASSQRAREALARSVRPSLEPEARGKDGRLVGALRSDGGVAVDMTVLWTLTNGDSITDQIPRLAAASEPHTLDLKPNSAGAPWQEVKMVWLDYWDESRVGHWRDTWQMGAEPHNQGRFALVDSRLVN